LIQNLILFVLLTGIEIMKAKSVSVDLSQIKKLLYDVYDQAVNSYYDLREITVEKTIQNWIDDYEENLEFEIKIKNDSKKAEYTNSLSAVGASLSSTNITFASSSGETTFYSGFENYAHYNYSCPSP